MENHQGGNDYSVENKQTNALSSNKLNALSSNNIPDSLNTNSFKKTWQEWLHYRKEKKHSLTASTIKLQLKKLSQYGEQIAIKMINNSITNGWLGLFELKEKQITPEQIERERRAEEQSKREVERLKNAN